MSVRDRAALLVLAGAVIAPSVACRKDEPGAPNHRREKDGTAPEPAGSATPPSALSPACETATRALEPWLAALGTEVASYEIDFGSILQPIARAARPVPQLIDNVTITPTTIKVFDQSEHDHVPSNPGAAATQQALDARLADVFARKAPPADHAEPDTHLRVDVDQATPWHEAARVLTAAARAGYTHVVFGFTATSTLDVPPGVSPQTTTYEQQKAATDRLAALKARCEPLGSASWEADPAKRAAATAAALRACNCAVSVDELRAQTWIANRWHQAVPRVPVVVRLSGDDPPTRIAHPAQVPWSEAHAAVIAAVHDGDPPHLTFAER